MKLIGVRAIKGLAVVVVIVGALVLYNYLRHVVIWFPKESVTCESADGVRLSGLLMKPSDEGVFPAAVVLQPSGLTATFSGDGSLVGNTVVATIALDLTAPGRPAQVQSESLRGSILGPLMLTLTADRWSVDTGGCVIEPPVAYEIIIQ